MDKRLAVAAAAVSVVAATAVPANAGVCNSPVGSWNATVTRPGVTMPIQLYFAANGVACLVTTDGESIGSWTRTGHDTFNYQIKEALVVGGVTEGWIYIDQDARQRGEKFGSSGTSTVYSLDGSLLEAVGAQVTADRASTTVTVPCPE